FCTQLNVSQEGEIICNAGGVLAVGDLRAEARGKFKAGELRWFKTDFLRPHLRAGCSTGAGVSGWP
ncbi:MAG: hypothetical protein WAL75_11205, partial [Terracidiphilus sp.]